MLQEKMYYYIQTIISILAFPIIRVSQYSWKINCTVRTTVDISSRSVFMSSIVFTATSRKSDAPRNKKEKNREVEYYIFVKRLYHGYDVIESDRLDFNTRQLTRQLR